MEAGRDVSGVELVLRKGLEIRGTVVDDRGARLRCETYFGERLTDDPTAADWYLELMLEGARAAKLPMNSLSSASVRALVSDTRVCSSW